MPDNVNKIICYDYNNCNVILANNNMFIKRISVPTLLLCLYKIDNIDEVIFVEICINKIKYVIVIGKLCNIILYVYQII